MFLTGRHFRILDASAAVSSLTISRARRTYVRINCFGF